MKNVWQQIALWFMALVALISLVPTAVFAVSGTVYFGPDGNTLTNGSEFYVEVKGNVPDPGGWWGGGGTVRFTFDPTKLQFISADDSGGVFRQNNNHNWGNDTGVVHYRAQIYFNAPGVNNQKIIGARFKAIGTGTTTLSFQPETNINDGPTTGTPKTFTILPVSCPAGQIGTPPNCTTPAPTPTTTPTPTKSPTPSKPATQSPMPSFSPTPTPLPTTEVTPAPTEDNDGGLSVENVKMAISRQKNIITWSMNRPEIKPELSYGLSKSNMKNKADVRTLSDGSFEATLTNIKPGTLYYYAIKATTPDQLKSANYGGSFISKGYPVQITVKQNGVLAPDARVKFGERSFVANKNATITAELGDGTYTAIVTPKDSTLSYTTNIIVKKVTIPSTGEPSVQNIILDGTIQSTGEVSNDNPLPIVLGALTALAGLGFIGFIVYRKKHNEPYPSTAVDTDLLISNYGNAIDDARAQTPDPNLDVQAATLTQGQAEQYPLPEQQYYSPPAQSTATSLPEQAPSIPTDSPQISQNNHEEVSPPVAAVEEIYLPEPMSSSEQIDEQLSEPVVSVESMEENKVVENTSTFEEAIYHPETGELDIIHSNNHSPHPPEQTTELLPEVQPGYNTAPPASLHPLNEQPQYATQQLDSPTPQVARLTP